MVKVLFVCHGNICRSPMAEAVFEKLVQEAGLDGQISVDSAGTAGYHVGENAHHGTLKVLQKNGIVYDGHSRRLTRADLQSSDYVIAMDDENYADIMSLSANKGTGTLVSPTVKFARLLDYAPDVPEREIPDPYYNGGFDHVYDLVLAGGRGLLAQIRKDHRL